jgi:hypothetical protein
MPERASIDPRIGPCRDPLGLWFLEWRDAAGQRWRRYFANRAEARAALAEHRACAAKQGEGT